MTGRLAAALLAALLTACGGPEAGPLALELRTQLLPAEITSAELILFTGDVDCDAIRLSGFERDGVYNQNLRLQSAADDAVAELFDIVPGVYTAAVWAFSGPATPFAFACSEAPLVIEAGRQARLTLELAPF